MKSLLRYIRQSLAHKLTITVLILSIAVFVVVLGLLYLQSRYMVKQMAVNKATSALNVTAQQIVKYMSTIETATNSNAWLIETYLQPDSLLNLSRRIVMLNAHTNGCSINMEPDYFPQYGRYFSVYTIREGDSLISAKEAEYDYFEKVWYKNAAQQQKACWVEPFYDDSENSLAAKKMLISYSKPLYDRKGKFAGILSTDLALDNLNAIAKAQKPYPNSYFIMIGEGGHYFIHPDTTKLYHQTIFSERRPREHSDIITLGYEMTTGKTDAMKIDVEGKTCMACYHTIPGTSWSIALITPEDDILYDYNNLSYIVLPLLGLGMILILLLTRQIVTKTTSPIMLLARQSKRIAAGDYNTEISHVDSTYIIGRLQNSFATMQQSLVHHISTLQQMNEEAKHHNEELQKARTMAHEAYKQKMAFIQNMTHQLRTPLNIILGFAQVLRDSLQELHAEEVKSITNMIDHNAKLLNRMNLMLYDSSDTGQSEELESHKDDIIGCNKIASECIEFAHSYFPEADINFKTTVPDTLTIKTNHLYLMRSIRELLYNAVKYSDGKNITLYVSQTENQACYTIEDTGSGIPEEYLKMMYTPFTKVNDLTEGLGLGLPLVKRHIDHLGGNICLDSKYTKGCRFVITLPLGEQI